MAATKHALLLLVAIFTINHATPTPTPTPSPLPSPAGIKAGYWPSWTASSLSITAIDKSLFTHLFYAFLFPDPTSFKLLVSKSDDAMLRQFTSTLHGSNSPAKTLLSIAGGSETQDPTTLSHMSAKVSSRRDFINSTIQIARNYGFDGLDLDWEFPENQQEMDNFGSLLEEWRVAIDKEARATGNPPLLLTAAAYFAADFFLSHVHRSYPATSMQKNLDWINLMWFDYHGSWDTSTGAHSALFDPTSQVSTNVGMQLWINAGVSSHKIIMGLPLYGWTWKLKNPEVHGIGAPAVGVGPGEGQMTFSEVDDFNRKMHATVVYDEDTVTTYSYVATSWIGYDDPTSVGNKIGFARAHGLSGYFFWAISGDKDWKLSTKASQAWDH